MLLKFPSSSHGHTTSQAQNNQRNNYILMADCRGRRSFQLDGLLWKSRIELVKIRRRSLGLLTRRNSPAFISSSQILSLEKESTPNYMRVSNSIQQTVDWEMLGEADVEKDDDVGEKNRGDLGKGASAGLDIHLPTAAAADSSAMSVKEKDKKPELQGRTYWRSDEDWDETFAQ
ncbi:hypothetical protein HPP92_024945 [Vanilla planifolia]|uniref:Uncharacterized protein n=1 Tax=Vanilla planifolia TaxID=51239 RepID=A0A835PMY6_VANPL|nr:hypothetical protein HPP92_024945 [Vanilla planifolia]